MRKFSVLLAFIWQIMVQPACAQLNLVTEAEAMQLGHYCEQQMSKGNGRAFIKIIDVPAYTNLVLEKSSAARQHNYIKRFLPNTSLLNLGDAIEKMVNDGSFRFFKTYEKNGSRRLVFRAIGESGLNYYNLPLIKVGDSIKASDMFVFYSGQFLSTLSADILDVEATGCHNRQELLAEIAVFNKMRSLRNKGDYAGIKTLYDNLDTRYHKNRNFHVINIDACKFLGSELYRDALQQYFTSFPEAGNSWLMKMNLYSINRDYKMMLFAIDKVDSLAGGDPLLDYYRGSVYLSMDSIAQATAHFTRAFAFDPSFRLNVKQLIAAHASAGDFDKAKEVVAIYLKTNGASKVFAEKLYDSYPELTH